ARYSVLRARPGGVRCMVLRLCLFEMVALAPGGPSMTVKSSPLQLQEQVPPLGSIDSAAQAAARSFIDPKLRVRKRDGSLEAVDPLQIVLKVARCADGLANID